MNPAVVDIQRSVSELLGRCAAGVFAWQGDEGTWHRVKSGAPTGVNLGLTVRLQHAVANQFLGAVNNQKAVPQSIESEHPLEDDLPISSTGSLMAKLYKCPGEWVLALGRHRKTGGVSEGTLWNGSMIGCLGLASYLTHRVMETEPDDTPPHMINDRLVVAVTKSRSLSETPIIGQLRVLETRLVSGGPIGHADNLDQFAITE